MSSQMHLQGHEPESRPASASPIGWVMMIAAIGALIMLIVWGILNGVF